MLRESGEFSLPLLFCMTYTIINKYYPGEPGNTHIKIINKYDAQEKLGKYHQNRVKVN